MKYVDMTRTLMIANPIEEGLGSTNETYFARNW